MPISDIFKVSRKTFFNPTAWLDLNAMKDSNRFLWGSLKTAFTPEKPGVPETFEQAKARLQLSDQDISNMISTYRKYALLFVACGMIVFFFSFFLLFRYTAFLDWFLGMAVTILFLTQAFRYDFWVFQMKSRKLGRTFKEWKRHILGEGDVLT